MLLLSEHHAGVPVVYILDYGRDLRMDFSQRFHKVIL